MVRRVLFGEELGFGEADVRQFGIVCLTDDLAHIAGLEYRSILLEEALIVPEMVGVHFSHQQTRTVV